MAIRSDGQQTQKRILSTCVRLFLENGYHQTTIQQICKEAQVSTGSFFNLFHSKDGVLMELLQFMYQEQFATARQTTGESLPPVYVYAVETSLQIALTELNENLRDIYLEVYTKKSLLDFVQNQTSAELFRIFGSYQPELSENDFLAMEFCTAGMMRGCMANPCTATFPLEKKLQTFLSLSLRAFKVPEAQVQAVLAFLTQLDIRSISGQIMEKLFRQLAMRYEFSLGSLLPGD